MAQYAVFLLLLLLATPVAGKMLPENNGCGTKNCAACHTLTVKEAGDLLNFAGITVKSVKPSASRGLHEIMFEKNGGVGIVFIDYAKKHLVQGIVIDLATKEPVTAHDKDLPKPKQFSGVDPKLIPVQHGVVMGSSKASKKLYVFTDPDCPYCRQLHPILQQLEKQLPDLAITVMLYPLRQLHPQAYDKSRVVVASQKRDLLDKAFEGKELPRPKGDEGKAAVDAIIKFAEERGINGTPLILLPNGKPYQGPRNVEAIKKAVEGK